MAWNRGIPGSVVAVSAMAMMCAAAAAQGVPPNYSWNWATIGAPGNPAHYAAAFPGAPGRWVGNVDYTYRMATTEVTGSQWLEFVRNYAQYVSNDEQANSDFTSGAIVFIGRDSQNRPQYSLAPIYENVAVGFSWRYAARYCNWLHNDKALTRDAYERGAYDTSTFTQNPDGTYNDQATHSPGARYWIPSDNEWTKAAYYDPNKFGPGQGGYWRYPNGSDTPLVGGLPGEPGAQSSGPLPYEGPSYQSYNIPVGSYPGSNRPWGLLDTSGGASEWTETWGWVLDGRGLGRTIRGSGTGAGEYAEYGDNINADYFFGPNDQFGLRLASAIPSPGSMITLAAFISTQRRRRS